MKTLPAPNFLIYAVFRALRHPRTPRINDELAKPIYKMNFSIIKVGEE